MKVTSGNNPTPPPGKKVEKSSIAKDSESTASYGLSSEGASEKADFAEVLERVTRAHKEATTSHADRRSDQSSEARPARTREEEKVEEQQSGIVETSMRRDAGVVVDAAPEAQAILHPVDLDSIVTACQVQLAANGQQQVILDLSRSVLEGLRVKLTADAAGRITVDLLAASEGIKSLLDGRSRELIEMLRARGVDLAEFKSSVARDMNSGADSRSRENATEQAQAVARSTTPQAITQDEQLSTETDDLAKGATYRA